ncbi:helix-turn-helix transcriptional regulator [Nocardioides zeae]|uniref:HTH-type transcriptional regulator RipA n=2 Tax=Nocardioides zeae TaxID=1457234 RepID=A0A6P0HNP3_9ACTN|nr:helix-turn-helix transcriptional regulator [Nocardioides zeae]
MVAGSMRLTVGGTTWELGADHVAWIPAGALHEMTITRTGTLVDVYADPVLRPQGEGRVGGAGADRPAVLAVEPMAATLLRHAAEAPRSPERRRLAYRLLLDVLGDAPLRHDVVALPADPRARRVAVALLDDPADPRTLGDWAADLHVSEKTLARAFVAGTGLTFRQWRLRRRLQAAAGHLVDGLGVAEVAERVGYASPSAFIASFAEVYGCTPRRYAANARAADGMAGDRMVANGTAADGTAADAR